MNVFVWGPDIEQQVRRVRAHAEKPENWFRPHLPTQAIPGDDPNFVVHAGTVRAVFTWSVDLVHGVFRHLTLSVLMGRTTHGPNPMACWTLAHHFGFNGARDEDHGFFRQPGPDWMLDIDPREDCVVIAQLMPGVQDERPPSALH